MAPTNGKRLRVGMVGAGEVAQVIHLPVLQLMSDLYELVMICDISKKNADHCATKFHLKSVADANDIFQSPDVDVVFILTSDEFHEPYTIAALQAGKHVMVEKPFTLSTPSARRMIEAENNANGPKAFVGYMRRYAQVFNQAFKREVASIPRILYARSRDFSGPNAKFVSESGTFQVKNTDFPDAAGKDRASRLDALYAEAFPDQEVTEEHIKLCKFLGSLGSHDISLMREILGFPESVTGVSVNDPFYSAIFNYRNESGEPFSATYESGIDGVPVFDAHLAIYGEKKRVTIHYDSPYVKGLPTKVVVNEVNESGELEERIILGSYEDHYTEEFKEMYDCLVNGSKIKTTLEDASNDLLLYDMIYASWLKGSAT